MTDYLLDREALLKEFLGKLSSAGYFGDNAEKSDQYNKLKKDAEDSFDKKLADTYKVVGNEYVQNKAREKDTHRFRKAIQLYKTAIFLHKDVTYVSNLAGIFFLLGDYTNCLEQCNQALKLDPNFSKVHARLAQVYERQGKFQEALDAANKTLALDPSNKQAEQVKTNAVQKLAK